MPQDVFPTTAEHIIAVTDAVTTRENGCDDKYVAQFIDVPQGNAQNALEMAKELGLVCKGTTPNSHYFPKKPFAIYMVTAKDSQKAAVLRLVLESFEPYCVFKQRLAITGLAAAAAEQVKLIFNLTPHRDEIKDTFISLGTFTHSLITEGAGLFKVVDYERSTADFLHVVVEVVADRGFAEASVRKRLGDVIAAWINPQDVLSPLITAYQHIGLVNEEKTCVVHTGNAVESFLVQLALHLGVSLVGATGINGKVDKFGNKLNTKHKNILKYLGHIRNAADHGIDSEIGVSWEISTESATEYVHVAISTIKSMVSLVLKREFVL